jgi:hypothetical protein
LTLKCLQFEIRPYEGFLDDVLGFDTIPHQMHDRVVEPILVDPDKPPEGGGAALQRFVDESRLVVHAFSIPPHAIGHLRSIVAEPSILLFVSADVKPAQASAQDTRI